MSEDDNFYGDVDSLLDDWFTDGAFSGMTAQSAVARMLREQYPHLSTQGARSIVRVWFDCARDMGEID